MKYSIGGGIFSIDILKMLLLLVLTTPAWFCGDGTSQRNDQPNTIDSLVMNLNAFGVESDTYPSIQVYLDFLDDSSHCIRTYYNPSIKVSEYQLSSVEMASVRRLVTSFDFRQLDGEYTIQRSDQPRSTIQAFHLGKRRTVSDYGLGGPLVLQKIYKIVYKF